MKRVVLTGGTGFIGANLARRLLRDGHAVHLLVRPGHAGWRIEEIRRDVKLHEVNFEDVAKLQATVAGIKPEWVFHLAAHGGYSWQTDGAQMIQTNIIGTVNVVAAGLAAGCEALVHAGSSSEYGLKNHAPAENELLEPNSQYAVTKAAATLFCRLAAQQHRAQVTTLRLYSAYGPYEDPGRLMPTLIRRALKGEWPPLVAPDTARDFVHTDDVCEAFVLAAQKPSREFGAVYNVGSGIQTTLREVAETARRELCVAAEPQWGSMPARAWDTTTWVADNRKIRAELGWHPRLTFAQGFQRLVEWHRNRPDTGA